MRELKSIFCRLPWLEKDRDNNEQAAPVLTINGMLLRHLHTKNRGLVLKKIPWASILLKTFGRVFLMFCRRKHWTIRPTAVTSS